MQANKFKSAIIFLQVAKIIMLSLNWLMIILIPLPHRTRNMYLFDKSAHFPHIEESGLFQKIMIEEILPLVKSDSLHEEFTEHKAE